MIAQTPSALPGMVKIQMLEGELVLRTDLYSETPSKACWEEAHIHARLLVDDCHMTLGKLAYFFLCACVFFSVEMLHSKKLSPLTSGNAS